MQLRYGNYLFNFNGTMLTSRAETLFNQGGQPYAIKKVYEVQGFLEGDGQGAITLLQSGLQAALAANFQDLVFYQDSGAASADALLNAGSSTGVRITHVNFPTTVGAEYATFRSFSFTAEAEYPLLGSQNLLLSWRETLSFSGGGPIYRHRLAINGAPQKQLVYPASIYTVNQSGQAEGYLTYPVAPAALWPFALKEQPKITRSTPTRKGPAAYQAYPVSWSYDFESAAPLLGLPSLWPI